MGSRWRHPKGSSSSSLFLNLSRRRGRVTDTVKISQFLPYCDVHLSATDCRKGLGSIDLMRQRNKCTAAFKFLFLNFHFCSWDVGIALRFMLSKFLEKFCIHHQRDVFNGRSSYDLKVKKLTKKTKKKTNIHMNESFKTSSMSCIYKTGWVFISCWHWVIRSLALIPESCCQNAGEVFFIFFYVIANYNVSIRPWY